MRRVVAAALALSILHGALVGGDAVQAADGGSGRLRAGAARVDIGIPSGAPLAGYGAWRRRLVVPDVLGRYPHAFWFKPSDGTLDPPAVRALVLYTGETRVTWVTVDVVAVTADFTRRLGQRLSAHGIRAGTLIVSASHTHSGPGGFLPGPALFAVSATDREAPAVRDAVVDAIVEAVRRAGASARDARLAAGVAEAPAVLTRGRMASDPDRTMVVLAVRSVQDEPIAIVWNYAIHPTMLGPGNLKLSGDVTGAASRRLEATLGVPALYVNGAAGDVSPRAHGRDAVGETADALVTTARAALAAARAVTSAPLVVRSARVTLPSPALSLKHCLHGWLPSWASVPLSSMLPDSTEMIGVSIGGVAWVTMPGEPVSALGRDIRAAARARWEPAFVAGVSNDYLGYFVRPEDYAQRGYVTCAAVYGPRAGRCLAATAIDLLNRLPEAGAMVTGSAPECDRR